MYSNEYMCVNMYIKTNTHTHTHTLIHELSLSLSPPLSLFLSLSLSLTHKARIAEEALEPVVSGAIRTEKEEATRIRATLASANLCGRFVCVCVCVCVCMCVCVCVN